MKRASCNRAYIAFMHRGSDRDRIYVAKWYEPLVSCKGALVNPPVPRGSAQAEATVRRFGAHRKCVGSTAASAVPADQQLRQL